MSSQNPHSPPPDDQARPGQVTIDNVAPNQGMQGTARDVTIHHHHGPAAPPTPSTLTARQRAELLNRLARRYQELLDHALPHQVRLQLGLHTRPDAVDPAWRRMLLRGPRASFQPVPLGISPLELFDGQQGQLLVLGAPGAGKTTLIVELAQALTTRALADTQARLPVVLNVAAWRSGQSLRDWLAPTLRDLLGASKRFAAQLAASDDLLLLLDGLDEVAADHRAACVAAINAYLGERELAPPLVVGCRSREYADMGARLVIAGAVELEPLELPAIEQALVGVPAAQGVLLALQTDELLRELATTPLMVNVLLLAHGGQEVPPIYAQTLEERRVALWHAYICRMFLLRPLKERFWRVARVLRWLWWLAELLEKQDETDFLLDDLQPHMLSTKGLLLQYKTLVWVFTVFFTTFIYGPIIGWLSGLLFGVALSVLYTMIHIGEWVYYRVSLWSYIGFIISLPTGIICASVVCLRKSVLRQEKIVWKGFTSFSRIFYRTIFGMVFGGISLGLSGLITTFPIGLWHSLQFGIDLGIESLARYGKSGAIFGGIVSIFMSGWQIQPISNQDIPTQRIIDSLILGTTNSLIIGFLGGLVFGFAMWPISNWNVYELLNALYIGIPGVIVFGLFLGFIGSISTFLQHLSLRIIIFSADHFPFRAVTFLDAMTDRLLLERDGAFYRFRHLLLRDFIADLSDDDMARLAREIDGDGVQR